jgi:exonuclease III
MEYRMWANCRSDCQVATPGLAARARKTRSCTGERFGDHAPLIVVHDAEP